MTSFRWIAPPDKPFKHFWW